MTTSNDVRSQLPFEDNVFGVYANKTSLTFHWNGPPVNPGSDPMDVLKADAAFHIGKGWGGISYHKAISFDGTVYLTRDPEAVLAACGNAIGNARSTHVQVMIGTGQTPTIAQWFRMGELAREQHTVYPHNFWSGTQCPGADITEWINQKGWDNDMTPEEARAIAEKVLADAGLDQNTIGVIKKNLDEHFHKETVPFSSRPIVPPVAGAQLNATSADMAQLVWVYPDGTVHTWINGREVTP
jgi:hypothetical protein